MHQVRHHAGLGPELLADLRLTGDQPRVENLDRTGSTKILMLGLVNPGHRAVADHRPHLVLTEQAAGQIIDERKAVVEVGWKLP